MSNIIFIADLDILNAYCLYDEQCTNILNTECSGNHCVCKDTYAVYNDVECVKNAGGNFTITYIYIFFYC